MNRKVKKTMEMSDMANNYIQTLSEAGVELVDGTYAPKAFVVKILRLIEKSIANLKRGNCYGLDELLGGFGYLDRMCLNRRLAVFTTVDTLIVDGAVPLALSGSEGDYDLLTEEEFINRAV